MIPVVKSTYIRTPNTCRIARIPRATGGFSDVQESLASGGQLPLTLESLHAHTRSHYADYRLIGGLAKGEGGLRKERIFPSRGLPQPSTITRIETNGRVIAGKFQCLRDAIREGESSLPGFQKCFRGIALQVHSLQIAIALHAVLWEPLKMWLYLVCILSHVRRLPRVC